MECPPVYRRVNPDSPVRDHDQGGGGQEDDGGHESGDSEPRGRGTFVLGEGSGGTDAASLRGRGERRRGAQGEPAAGALGGRRRVIGGLLHPARIGDPAARERRVVARRVVLARCRTTSSAPGCPSHTARWSCTTSRCGRGPASVRAPSGFARCPPCSPRCLPVIAVLGRRLGGWKLALIAPALLAVGWMFGLKAAEARSYSLETLLVLIGWYALIRAVENGALGSRSRWWWALVALIGGLGVLAHGLFPMFVSTWLLAVVLAPGARRAVARFMPTLLCCGGVLLVLYRTGASHGGQLGAADRPGPRQERHPPLHEPDQSRQRPAARDARHVGCRGGYSLVARATPPRRRSGPAHRLVRHAADHLAGVALRRTGHRVDGASRVPRPLPHGDLARRGALDRRSPHPALRHGRGPLGREHPQRGPAAGLRGLLGRAGRRRCARCAAVAGAPPLRRLEPGGGDGRPGGTARRRHRDAVRPQPATVRVGLVAHAAPRHADVRQRPAPTRRGQPVDRYNSVAWAKRRPCSATTGSGS